MSEWTSRFTSNPIWEKLRSARAQLDQIAVTPDDPPEIPTDLTRLRTVIQTIESRLKGTDPLLLHPGPLASMDTHLQSLVSEVAAFAASRNRANLVNANNQADSLLVYAAQLPLVPGTEVLEESQGAVDRVRDLAEKVIGTLQGEERRLREQLTLLEQRLEVTTLDVATQKGRLDAAIAEYQQQFSTSEAARQAQAVEAQHLRTQRLDQEITDAQKRLQESVTETKASLNVALQSSSAKVDEQNAALKASGEEILKTLEEFRKKAENVMHVIGSTGMAGEYQKAANIASNRSTFWQAIAGASMLGLIGFAITVYHATQTDQIHWGSVSARVFVTITFGILAAYCARQSDHYTEIEVRNRRYQLELSSIDPYLANIPAETQRTVKVELAQKLFGNVSGPMTASKKEVSGSVKDVTELVRLFLDFLKKQGH